jgi:hypothetical protein
MALQKLGSLVLTAIVCVAPLGCKSSLVEHKSQRAATSRHNGVQWLAWSDHERIQFVAAYIDGYETGAHDACASAGDLLDLKANHNYEHAPDEIVLPSGVCRKAADHYSRFEPNSTGDPDVSAYTSVLSHFYTEHSEYQDIPYEYLMKYLTDEQKKTADDLFKMAKYGEMRTHW